MSWRIVYIENSDYLNTNLDNIKIRKGNDETSIPLSDINSIIIDNNYTTITTGLINKCMEYKINLVICDYMHLPNAYIHAYSGNYQSALMLNKQINWDKQILYILWGKIVKSKINNQMSVLTYLKRDASKIQLLNTYIDEVKMNDESNREGLAAKVYFRELFGNSFKRFEEDIYNICLNYGYSILRSQISRELISRGLNPHIGIFHKGPNNAFNLSDDIIEVFRPIVDLWIISNINQDDVFNRDIRLKLIELTTKRIIYDNKKVTIINAINILVTKILTFIELGEVDILTFPNVIYYDE